MQKLIVDWGSGSLPWPFFPFGVKVGFRSKDKAPSLVPNHKLTLENAASQTDKAELTDFSMELKTEDYSQIFNLGTIPTIELPQPRRLKAGEKYVAVTDHVPSSPGMDHIVKMLKAEYGESFGGFKESSGTRLPFESASVDELHMHWLLSAEDARGRDNSTKIEKFLKEAKRIVKPKGLLIVSDTEDLLTQKKLEALAQKYRFALKERGGLKQALTYTIRPLLEERFKKTSHYLSVLEKR